MNEKSFGFFEKKNYSLDNDNFAFVNARMSANKKHFQSRLTGNSRQAQ